MKVAFISYDFGEYCIRLASALAQEAEVCLMLPQQLADPHLSKLDPTVQFRPFDKPRLRQPLRQMRVIYHLLRQIRRFDPDVVHMQQGHLWFNLALPLLRRYPLVITVHDPTHHMGDRGAHNTPESVLHFGFRRADQLIVQARQMADVVTDELGIPGEIVHTVPHLLLGDDTLHPETSEDESLILFFGRIWEYKGLEYLIRAEPLITAGVPNAKIMIAGRGEDFGRYRQMMVHPERFIVRNEFIPDDEIAALFRRASVVVLPYVEATQSGVIPTAYTFAKPVVATTVGGLPDQVEHERTGFLVPPRDENALAERIVQLLRDPALRRQLGTNGKRKLETEWSAGAIARQTAQVYRRALGFAEERTAARNPSGQRA